MNSNNRAQESKTNPQVKSSIVHKPFATGTINIFNPYRNKSEQPNNQPNAPKLFLHAELEQPPTLATELTSESELREVADRDRRWLENLLNPWSISAIAIIFFVNLVSGAVIWRDRLAANPNSLKAVSTLGKANLAAEEFMPLNLSTLSVLKSTEDTVEEPVIEPISPALAPINHTAALSSINSPYFYILSEYTGDRSLALAQQQVKQVSLVNFPEGIFIYLGAFTNQEQADKFVSQLKTKEFTARVYPFD
ncbi:MAG: SPOR domain-containing protein [Pleurocapsa sp.]